jgi:hypothetical protein
MFDHYESEQDKKLRQLRMSQPQETKPAGPERRGGGPGGGRSSGGGRSQGSFVFEMKNNTVYIPLNTMWLRFRAASSSPSGGGGSFGGGGSRGAAAQAAAPAVVRAPARWEPQAIRIRSGPPPVHSLHQGGRYRKMDEALQQAKNVLMHTHKGVEDFSFRTQENWSEGITRRSAIRE